MFKKITSGIIVMLSSVPVFADQNAQILSVNPSTREITVAYDPANRWAPTEPVCVFQGAKSLTCGQVSAATRERLDVKVASMKASLRSGTWVSLKRVARRPAATAQSTEQMIAEVNTSRPRDISLGMTAGFNYFFPTLQLQHAIGRDFSVGIMPLYVNFSEGGSSVKAWGGFVTGSYYYTHFPFRGLSIQAGGGFYNIDSQIGNLQESVSQPAVFSTLNWRGRASWELGLDIGVGLGAQYLFPTQRKLSTGFSGILPMLTLNIAHSF